MTAVAIFAMLAGASWLLCANTAAQWPQRRPPRTPRNSTLFRKQPGRPRAEVVMIRVVRQLAALLTSGRSGPRLWEDVALALAAESGTDVGGTDLHTVAHDADTHRTVRRGTVVGGAGGLETDPSIAAHLRVIGAAQRAAFMGLPASEAIRAACAVAGNGHMPRSSRLKASQLGSWYELAASFDVSEASGAPLALVLQRFATRLESELDAAALRETALAGPRATVRLLSWLPVLGLVLGMAIGVDPFSVLLASPIGWATLLAGAGLTIAGRMWSHRLIATAAKEKPAP